MAAAGKAKKVDGKDILIFIGGKAIALTTDTTLSLKADTQDTSSKDDGIDGEKEITQLNWSASNDSYYSADERTADVVGDDLMDAFWKREVVEVVVGTPTNKSDSEVPTEGWTAPTISGGWKGKAIITTFDLKATNGQKATCSLSLEGIGRLTKLGA